MIKSEELTNPNSCMSKARNDEMTFVLLGRDIAAPSVIRAWVQERIRLGKNTLGDAQIQEALACADTMDKAAGRAPTPAAPLGAGEALRDCRDTMWLARTFMPGDASAKYVVDAMERLCQRVDAILSSVPVAAPLNWAHESRRAEGMAEEILSGKFAAVPVADKPGPKASDKWLIVACGFPACEAAGQCQGHPPAALDDFFARNAGKSLPVSEFAAALKEAEAKILAAQSTVAAPAAEGVTVYDVAKVQGDDPATWKQTAANSTNLPPSPGAGSDIREAARPDLLQLEIGKTYETRAGRGIARITHIGPSQDWPFYGEWIRLPELESKDLTKPYWNRNGYVYIDGEPEDTDLVREVPARSAPSEAKGEDRSSPKSTEIETVQRNQAENGPIENTPIRAGAGSPAGPRVVARLHLPRVLQGQGRPLPRLEMRPGNGGPIQRPVGRGPVWG